MKLYIEGIIFLSLFFIVLIWYLWYKWSERRLIKKYKPENDKGRKGNEPRETERRIENTVIDNDGSRELERQEFLQETDTNNDGRNTKRNRKFRFFRK